MIENGHRSSVVDKPPSNMHITQEIEPVPPPPPRPPDIHVARVPIHISAGTTAFRVPLITPIEASHLHFRTRISHVVSAMLSSDLDLESSLHSLWSCYDRAIYDLRL